MDLVWTLCGPCVVLVRSLWGLRGGARAWAPWGPGASSKSPHPTRTCTEESITLRALRKLYDAGQIRKHAKAIMVFDPMYGDDTYDMAQLRKSTWWKTNVTVTAEMDDKDACLKAKQVKPIRCNRAKGSMSFAVVPISEVPRRLPSQGKEAGDEE